LDNLDGWTFTSPREPLKPIHHKGDGELVVEGNGKPYVFGYWKKTVDVQGGQNYRFRVRLKADGIDDINLRVLNLILWTAEGAEPAKSPYDCITRYYREGGYIIGEQSLETAAWVTKAEIQLGVRYAASGRVSWREASLTPCAPRKSRPARITVMDWNAMACASKETGLADMERLLDQAGALGSDIVVFPEFSNLCMNSVFETVAEEIPSGETCRLIAAKARQHRMNICAGLAERDGDYLFNTAVLFNRAGELLGAYRKTHLYWPEAVFTGESPGDEYPVFDLDIGRVGVIICYDSWYAETARILALKGAELILFPNAGYEPAIIPARAIDNGVYMAVSSLGSGGMLVNTRGKTEAQVRCGMACAQIDLSRKPLPHTNAGGSMNSAPGGRRGARNAMSGRLYEEIKTEIGTWENRPEDTTWL